MIERILQAAFSRDVIVTVLLGQAVFTCAIVLLVGSIRVYRKTHRHRVLEMLGMIDSRSIRQRLERKLEQPASTENLAAIRATISDLTSKIYSINCAHGDDSELSCLKCKVEKYIAKRRFPELLLSGGERAELMCQKEFSGPRILGLFLKRELKIVYSLDVAVRALQAAEIEQPGPKETISVCRVRAATGRNLSRKVLRFVAGSAGAQLKATAQTELGAIGRVSHGVL